jgi:EmrB/QacA subfamily drug resistance transporter
MTDLVPGDSFPDIRLPEHTGRELSLSEIAKGQPPLVCSVRGWWCPKEQVRVRMLVTMQEEIQREYGALVAVTVDPPAVNGAFRAGVGESFPFLSDEHRRVARELDLLELTDRKHLPYLPFTFALDSGLRVHASWCGFWFRGSPTPEELRQALREIIRAAPRWISFPSGSSRIQITSPASSRETCRRRARGSAARASTAAPGSCTRSSVRADASRFICARRASRARARSSSTTSPCRRRSIVPVDARRQLTLVATVFGSSLAFVDASVVVVALPTIERDLGFGLAGEQWVYLAYSLALAALYLPAGAVGDRLGRRETFAVAIVGFAAASALAGAAPDAAVLIVARALQGTAGAFVTTNSLALLRETFGPESGRAVGLWTSFTGVATIGGPPLGGAIVQWVSWRWIFFVNLPLAAAAVYLALAGRCPQRERHRVGRLDLPGAALAAVGFGLLTYGMVAGADHGFGTVWWAFVLAALALAAFVAVELRAAEPMLPFTLFRRRNFAFANVETFLVYGSLGGMFFFFTIYLQFLGFSPLAAGLANVPGSVLMILLAPRFGRLADERGPRLLLTAGPALLGCGTFLWSFMEDRAGFWRFGIPGLALTSLGLAALVAPITATALSSAPERFSGIASGVNSTLSRLGNLLAVAALGFVVLLVFKANGGTHGVPIARGQTQPALRSASVDAFRVAMLVTTGLALCGAAVAALGISNAEARRTRDETEAPAPAAG